MRKNQFSNIRKNLLFFTIIATLLSCSNTIECNKNIAFWGDSMTQGADPDGVSMPGIIKDELKKEVFNGGVGGLNSESIACLQGGRVLKIKLDGDKIPASGLVNLTTYNIQPYIHTTDKNRLGSINGIAGTLTRVGNPINPIIADSFSFTRTTPGSEINIIDVDDFIFDDAINHRNEIQVIWAGRNDPRTESQISLIISNILSMTNFMTNKAQFLVISVCNGSRQTEGSGSETLLNIIKLNYELETTFGNKYINLRKYMVEKAIYDAHLIPTSEDLQDISADCIPSSLRYDAVHFNAIGNRMAGKYIANIIRSKKW